MNARFILIILFLQKYQIAFSFNILWATDLPTAPITPPPGWAELPHNQIPPTCPLNLFVKRF